MSIEQDFGGETIRKPSSQQERQSRTDRWTTTMIFFVVAVLLFVVAAAFASDDAFSPQGFPNVKAGLTSMGFVIGGGLALIAAALAKEYK